MIELFKQPAVALLVFVLGALLIAPTAATAKPVVHFAGFAYAGPYTGIATSFPYTASLYPPTGSTGPSPLDSRLLGILSKKIFSGFTLDFGSLGNVTTDDSLAVALVLDNESVSVEQIQANVYKLLVTLDAEAVFFDAKKMEIVASYPFGLDYIDALSTPPTRNYIDSIVQKIYLGEVQADLFKQFADALSKINLKPHYGNTIQVADVDVSKQAAMFMPENMQQDMAATKALIATQFADYLSKNANVPVLPYSKGYAIGNKIIATFANGDVFNLTIPSPDYVISLGIKGFKKVQYSQTPGGSAWIYGAFATVKVSEPLSNHVYMDVLAKNGAVKIIPATQANVVDWPAYQDSLLELMDQITAQFANPDQSWIKVHTGHGSNIVEFQSVTGVLKSCQ